jgi:hypothetical protein
VLLANGFIERNSWVPGVVVAVVLFLITTGLALYWRTRDRDSKHLDYRVISDTPIVVSRRKRPEILKVVYGATEVSNPYVTEVRFKNTGKQVIEPDDFLTPPAILRRNAKVLDFNIVDESVQGLIDFTGQTVDPPSEENPIDVYPKTLNPGDWFTIQVIYDGGEDTPVAVTGRIKGQTRPPRVYEDREPTPTNVKVLLAVAASVALIILTAGGYLAHVGNPSHPPSPSAGFYAGALAVLGGTIFGVVSGAVLAIFRKPPKFLARLPKVSA